MLSYERFSELRLEGIFSEAILEAYRYYIPIRANAGFDLEYMGGQWHDEVIDGVQLLFPARCGGKLAVAQVWAHACVAESGAVDRPAPGSGGKMVSWAENADRVLKALALPIRVGSPEAAVAALAAGRVQRSAYPDEWYGFFNDIEKGAVASLAFALRAPDIYHVKAVCHATEGLMKLEAARPDLIRRNEREQGYDAFFAGLYDEGPG